MMMFVPMKRGRFSFEGLQTGNYKVYVLSKDPLNEEIYYRVQKEVSIQNKATIVDTETYTINY